MDKKMIIIVLSLILSVAMGLVFSSTNIASKLFSIANHSANDNSIMAHRDYSNTLEEELWAVQLIVKGKVKEQLSSEKRDAGLEGKSNFQYEVTPSVIQIDEVIYGSEPENQEITLLQHGNIHNVEHAKHMVKKSEEVILFLVKTTDGYYWSYSFDDGIWRIKDDKVDSFSENPISNSLKGMAEKDFKEKIKNAALKKVKNKNTL